MQQPPLPAGRESVLQNTPAVNLAVFPEPRLQTNDAGEMNQFLNSEQEMLNLKQPFADPSGAVHIPISLAMQLIAERGLPVRPNAPPADFSATGIPEDLERSAESLEPGHNSRLEGAGRPIGRSRIDVTETRREMR